MPDINLLKNTEKYDPTAPKATPPPGPGPLSDPSLESTGFMSRILGFFKRRKTVPEPITPVLGQSVGGGSHMNLERGGRSDRILAEKKSKPTMIKLPEDEGSFSINLLGQDVGRSITLREQVTRLIMVAVGSLILVGLVYAGLIVYSRTISTDIQDTRAKIDALRSTISDLEKTQTGIAATTKKITAIRSLIDRHVYWSKFFHELEQATGPDVFYGTAFTGDLNGGITLAATTNSFDSVATQYLFFQQAVKRGGFITSFTISGATLQEAQNGPEVVFTATLVLAPEVFYKTAAEETAAPSANSQTTEPVGADLNANSTTNTNSTVIP